MAVAAGEDLEIMRGGVAGKAKIGLFLPQDLMQRGVAMRLVPNPPLAR